MKRISERLMTDPRTGKLRWFKAEELKAAEEARQANGQKLPSIRVSGSARIGSRGGSFTPGEIHPGLGKRFESGREFDREMERRDSFCPGGESPDNFQTDYFGGED